MSNHVHFDEFLLRIHNLVDLLEYRASAQPSGIAYRWYSQDLNEKSINYLELSIAAKKIALLLRQNGKVGDRINIVFPPGLELITAFFGCLYAGMIAVLVSPPTNSRSKEKFFNIVENSKPLLLLTTPDFKDGLFSLKTKFLETTHSTSSTEIDPFKILTISTEGILPTDWNYPKSDGNSLAFLQYSSGSTGHPKGVMVSHGNLIDNLKLMYVGWELDSIRNIIGWLPPYHDMGIIGQILAALFIGRPAALTSPQTFVSKPITWLKLITSYPDTATAAPNFAYNLCVQEIEIEEMVQLDLSSWRVAVNGAEPIRAETLNAFYEKFKAVGFKKETFFPGYGLAEATLTVSIKRYTDDIPLLEISSEQLNKGKVVLLSENVPGSKKLINCGKIFQDVRIVNPETLELCSEGEVGEIWINSPSVAKGYWRFKKKSTEIFNAKIQGDDSRTSYLRTGDLGFLHQNNLYFAGRHTDLIIIHGLNYYPQDIEEVIDSCHPAMVHGGSAAFALDSTLEEHLAIVSEIKSSSKEEEYSTIVHAILEAIEVNIGIAAHTIVLIPKSTIPKTSSGKIRRKQCLDNLKCDRFKVKHRFCLEDNLKEYKGGVVTEKSHEVERWITHWIADHSKIPNHKISGEHLIVEYGIDSLAMIQLSIKLSENFSVDVKSEDVVEYPSARQLAEYICHLLDGVRREPPNEALIDKPSTNSVLNMHPSVLETHQFNAILFTGKTEGKNDVVYSSLKELRDNKILGLTVISDKNNINHYIFPEIKPTPILSFFSCSYLSMEYDEDVKKSVIATVENMGSQLSSSRAIVSSHLYKELELLLEEMVGIPPIIAPTTTLGSLSALPVLIGKQDAIIVDEQVHNSVQMSMKLCMSNGTVALTIRHNSLEELESAIIHFRKQRAKNIWYLADGLYSMRGDFVPMHALLYLQEKYENFYTYIDDSHAFGWLGKRGVGYAAQFIDNPIFNKTVLISSLSKALAGAGGAIFTMNEEWREKITICGETMVFSGPIQPPILGGLIAAAKKFLSDEFPPMQKELFTKINHCKKLLEERQIDTISSGKCPIFFIKIGSLEESCKLFRHLLENNIYAPVIAFPAVPINQAGIRITINRLHKEEEITKTIDAIYDFLQSGKKKAA